MSAIPWKEEEKEEREHRILRSPVIRLISREPMCSAAALELRFADVLWALKKCKMSLIIYCCSLNYSMERC